ncbi:MAG TPA: tetratricopeptide repeat protein [Gaiellaceae bacterium]|nr:tetratricopeptide repeat protein [Gaiellaceae bacterium]
MPRRQSTHVDNPLEVGKRIRKARQAADLTQRQLAFPGCTSAYISLIESGRRVPSYQILREFGRRLGVSAEYLATGTSEAVEADPLFDAELAARLGDSAQARAAYESIIAEGNQLKLVARARIGLGLLEFEAGNHAEAIDLLEAGLVEIPAGSDTTVAADRLGRAYALTGRFDEALALFNRYLTAAKKRGDPLDSIRFSVLLANTKIDCSDYGGAATVLSEILELATNALDPADRAFIYWTQSRLHSSQDEPELAARYARRALSSLEQTEHTRYIANAFLLLATLENDQGHSREALALVERAEPVVKASGNRYDIGYLELERARAELGLGHTEEAASRALGSLPLLADTSPTNAGRSYLLAASIFKDIGDDAKALELYELAAESFPVQDRHAAEAYQAMAEIAKAAGRKDEALQYLEQALATRTNIRADV